MEDKIQALAQEIIAKIEQCKAQLDHDTLEKRKASYANPMHTGWLRSWAVYLSGGRKSLTVNAGWCPLIMIRNDELENAPLESDITGIFTEPRHRERLEELLQQWLVGEVVGQEYGGLYTEEVTLSVRADTMAQDDEAIVIACRDEGRIAQLLDNLRSFVARREYETVDLDRLRLDIKRTIFLLMHSLYPELGLPKLMEVVDALIGRYKQDPEEYYSEMEDVCLGARKALWERDPATEDTPEQLDLRCYICIILIQNGKDYEDVLRDIAQRYKHQWAKDILKFGSGKFNRDDTVLVHELVGCTANDVTRGVSVRFKQESEEAYTAVIGFLTHLIEVGFPQEYTIKANQKNKDVLPIKGLAKTTTNKFWNACRAFPGCFATMEAYVDQALSSRTAPFTYYGDTEEEQSVSVGGYATFVLGLESTDYFDTVRKYMQQTDQEHNLTADRFANAFIQKWGVTEQSALAVADCLLGANGHYLDHKLVLGGFDEAGPLAQLAAYIPQLKAHSAKALAGLIWGGEQALEQLAAGATEGAKRQYRAILAAIV